MKKILLLLCLVVALGAGAQGIQAGLKGGVNVSNFSGGNFQNFDKKLLLGYHAGAFLRFRAGGFAIQPELQFSTQGARLENATSEENYEVRYVNIPVMLQYIMPSGFYVEAGPQIGFRASENIPDQTIENFAKSTDLAIDFGLGFQTKAGFGIGARYVAGLTEVGNFDAANIDPDFRNGVLQLSVFLTLFGNRQGVGSKR